MLNHLHKRHESWRFHHLFRLLRLTQNRTRKRGWVGNQRVQVQERTHQLVHRLRHRNVESRQRRDSTTIWAAKLAPAARRAGILSGHDPPGSLSSRLKSSGWGVGGSRIVAVWFISRPHTPTWPSPGAVQLLGQGHRDGHPICSCLSHERSRRSLLRFAAELPVSRTTGRATLGQTPCCCCCCCGCSWLVVVLAGGCVLAGVFLVVRPNPMLHFAPFFSTHFFLCLNLPFKNGSFLSVIALVSVTLLVSNPSLLTGKKIDFGTDSLLQSPRGPQQLNFPNVKNDTGQKQCCPGVAGRRPATPSQEHAHLWCFGVQIRVFWCSGLMVYGV